MWKNKYQSINKINWGRRILIRVEWGERTGREQKKKSGEKGFTKKATAFVYKKRIVKNFLGDGWGGGRSGGNKCRQL